MRASSQVIRGTGVRCLLICAIFFCAGTAQAHRLGESYVYLDISESALAGRFEVTLDDLSKLLSLDSNGDGKITKPEFRARSADVHALFAPRLVFYDKSAAYPIVISHSEIRHYGIARYALVHFEVSSLHPVPAEIDVEYHYRFDGLEETHRGLLVIESNTRTGTVNNESQVSLIFGPGEERQNLNLTGTPWYKVFSTFVRHGVWHIWIGFDHILFIVSLLLPSVMVMRAGAWQPVDDFKSAALFVVKVVSLFTVAHSVTLSLSALGIISLPVRLVEAVIAASIIVVAANNIVPMFNRYIWLVVFSFGLFHGLGFANVLAPLGVEKSSLLTALIGFNVGVEIGQLAIVALIFPALYMLRNWKPYGFVILGLGSSGLIAIAAFWFVQRVFE